MKSTRISQSNSSGQLASNKSYKDDDDDDNPTPSLATPRKTPLTPSFTIGLADKGAGTGIGASSSAGRDRRSFSGPSATSINRSAPARRRVLAELMGRVTTDVDELSRKLSRKPPPLLGKKP